MFPGSCVAKPTFCVIAGLPNDISVALDIYSIPEIDEIKGVGIGSSEIP